MKRISFQLEDEFQNRDLELFVLSWMEALKAQNGSVAEAEALGVKQEWFPNFPERFRGWLEGISPELSGEAVPVEIPRDFDGRAALGELEELSKKRRLARIQQEMAADLYAGVPVAQLLGQWESEVAVLRAARSGGRRLQEKGLVLADKVLGEARQRQQRRLETGKPVSGISTGLTALDRHLNGLNPGLHVLAAGPGAGKTTLALQMAWGAAQAGHRVAYVTYENSMSNLMLKLLCAQCGLNPSEIERGLGDADKLEIPLLQQAEALDRLDFYEGGSEFRLSSVNAEFLIFDYLQRAAHGAGYEQLRHNVSAMTGQLREWAMERGAAVIAISSLNRSAADYGRGGNVSLENLKESGDLEYGADTVMLLYPPAEGGATPPARDLELRIAKNRFGPVGSLRLIFRPDIGVFRERL